MGSAKHPFIDKSNAAAAYDESVKWMRPYFDPLDEFERLARNRPSPRIAPDLPKITDGTLSAIVQEGPKRVVQQIPTGLVECKDYPGFAKIADLELRDYLIPSYNRQGDMLQKSWNMISKSMTYGRATSYTFYTSTHGKLHTDFVIPYVKDVITEKGKVFAPDCNISFLRSWYQKRDLQAIINKEKALQSKDKTYKSDWDLPALQEFMEAGASEKPADQQTPAEKEKGGDNGGFEIIHAFQSGIGAESYSFGPRFQEGKPLRIKVNSDPRGLMPLDHLYCNIDLSNPLGRGQVELSGGVQNLIDQQMQMFQYMTTMEMAPPLMAWGSMTLSDKKLVPNALWNMGSNPNNKIEPYVVSNFALQNFPGNYGLLKSQIMNLNSSQDHSISAESGNPAQSKTQAGVEAAESRLGVSDNYVRKQFESWFEHQSETSVNIQFAEMKGTRQVQLKGDDLKEIRESEAAQYVDEQGILTIPYKDMNKISFKLDVDPSSSEIKVDAENVDRLTEVYGLMAQDPDPEIQDKKKKLLKILVNEIGAEGTEELFPEEVDEMGNPIEQAPQQPPMTPEQVQQLVMQTVQEALQAEKANKPEEDPTLQLIKALGLKFNDLPEEARQIVLATTGFGDGQGEPTPAQVSQDLDMFDRLGNAENTINQNELSVRQADTADKQAEQQAAQAQQESQTSQAPQPAQDTTPLDGELSPEEIQIVKALTQRGFDENDIEQAIVMKRQGVPRNEIIRALGAKRGSVA